MGGQPELPEGVTRARPSLQLQMADSHRGDPWKGTKSVPMGNRWDPQDAPKKTFASFDGAKEPHPFC